MAASFHTKPHISPRQSRIVGALWGLHAGDSLGATLEFKTHGQIAEQYPKGLREIIGGGPFQWTAGHATDDTDMTRGVLLAHRDVRPGRDVARLAGDNFVDWFRGKWPDREPGSCPRDMGNATRQGLERYEVTRDPDRAGSGQGSAGNGSLMRCLPTALFQSDPKKRVSESIRISKITHDDTRCTIACAVYNTIAAELVAGSTPDIAIKAGELIAGELEKGWHGKVLKALEDGRRLRVDEMARDGPPAEMKGKASGYVLESLTIAIAAILDKRSFADVLVDVVRIGKDTDTNAAIAGGLLGARDGMKAIPEEWTRKLQFRKEFRDIALSLAKE